MELCAGEEGPRDPETCPVGVTKRGAGSKLGEKDFCGGGVETEARFAVGWEVSGR